MSPILLALVFQDQSRPKHPGAKPTVAVLKDVRPVTVHEARSSFNRCLGLLQKAIGSPLGTSKLPDANRAVTREEIVGEMTRIYAVLAPAYKFTPAPVKHDSSVFKISAAQRANLDKLVTRGCVARIGPLAVGPAQGLTVSEFGDALGFFVARVTEMTHLPSPKWTPRLQSDD